MKKRIIWVLLGVMLLSVACGGDGATSTPVPTVRATNTPEPVVEVTDTPSEVGAVTSLEDVKRATIRIEAQGSFVDPTGDQTSVAGSGSGFIIDPSGIAVTNNHVVAGAALLRVWVGGESEPHNAVILGVSECSDLAVIDLEGDGYRYLKWYDAEIKTGLGVYAAGFPLGDPEFTLTSGIVSKERANGETSWASVDAVIEHNATINPGSSGGPLVTKEGLVVAINYASRSSADQYFAIAWDEAVAIIDQLRSGEDVDSIGVNPQAVSLDSGLSGIWTASVKSGSPADKTGVKGGDIIVQLEGLDLGIDGTMSDYCDILRSHAPGDTLSIQVVRVSTEEVWEGRINGREMTLSFSFAQQGREDVSGNADDTTTYTKYVPVKDDSDTIVMEVPVEWNDVDGSAWMSGNAAIGVALLASPNLDEFFSSSYRTPGVFFGVVSGAEFDAADLLDANPQDDCKYEGRSDYQDQLYTGLYDLYTDCGDAGSVVFIVAFAPEDQTFLGLLLVRAVSEADLKAADHVLDTFRVVGEVPSGSLDSAFTLIVDNQSPDPVCHLYISDAESDSWGDDWLQSGWIEAGYTWIKDLPAGTYDVAVKDCDGAYMGTLWEIESDTALTIGGAGQTVSLRLKNESSSEVCGINISSPTSETWGENLLGIKLIQGRQWVFYIEPGTYDLRAQDCSGEDLQVVLDVDLTTDKLWTIGK